MNRVVAMTRLFPNLYYSGAWRRLHEKIDGGNSVVFTYESECGRIVYPLVMRPIHVGIDDKEYCDIATPKGYSGPTVLYCGTSKERLLAAYEDAFEAFCRENNVVCEFVRFNPWLENQCDFASGYDLTRSGQVFGVDLTVDDVFRDEFTSRARRNIRKAKKVGVTLEFDYAGESVSEFHQLYQYTIRKNKISPYYHLSTTQLAQYFEALKGKIFIVNACFGKQVVSSVIFIEVGDFIHYSYAASDPRYGWLQANSLVIGEACEKGKADGRKVMDLGGANNERLARFKKGFSRKGTVFDIHIGRRIRNNPVYDAIVERMGYDENYFPAYRHSGWGQCPSP